MVRHPFHKSSFRPQLIMGAERKPMLCLMLACVILGPISLNLIATGIAVFLWFVVHSLLILMGKTDPDMLGIYVRSQKYPGYIRPFTTPFRKHVGYRIASEARFKKVLTR